MMTAKKDIENTVDSNAVTGIQRSLWCEKNRGGKRHWTIPLAFSGATFTFKEILDDAA
jgi:hypothetical protein